MNEYLQATRLVNLNSQMMRETAERLVWGTNTPRAASVNLYNFCRNEIRFGYNQRDDISASEVLRNGYGQCNTKSVLVDTAVRSRCPSKKKG